MDTAKEWYAAVKEWQRARDELTAAIAAIKWPNPRWVAWKAMTAPMRMKRRPANA